MLPPLAIQQASETLSLSGGYSWWQALGGLVLVFGLLLLCLRWLGRLQRGGANGSARLLAVWSIGPKREIQALQLDDEVHYIYRHDGAMVLLKNQNLTEWDQLQARNPGRVSGGQALRNWRSRLLRKPPENPSRPLGNVTKS